MKILCAFMLWAILTPVFLVGFIAGLFYLAFATGVKFSGEALTYLTR